MGRDPQARVLRQFEPPAGFSPALTGYVYRYGWLDNLFTAVLVSLGGKRCNKIEEKDEYTLQRVENDLAEEAAEGNAPRPTMGSWYL